MARVRAVREAIGPAIGLTIDANCGWDADTAIRCVRELADCNLALDEQPTPDGDYGPWPACGGTTEAAVMADDICFNLVHAQELVRNDCCDVISVYPGKKRRHSQGESRSSTSRTSAALACSIGSNLELDVATAAMAHLVVACPDMQVEKYPGDMLGADYHEMRVASDPIQIEGPITTITDRPGPGRRSGLGPGAPPSGASDRAASQLLA